jgi:hypothetical protein
MGESRVFGERDMVLWISVDLLLSFESISVHICLPK